MMRSSLHHLLLAIAGTMAITVAVSACSHGDSKADVLTNSDFDVFPQVETPVALSGPIDTITVHNIPVHVPPGRLADLFNDTNAVQLSAAMAVGLDPLHGLTGVYNTRHDIVKIKTCDNYLLAPLYHSMPYLTLSAAQLLRDIGQAFHDTVKARGGKEYRIKVTSLMRSTHSVSRLRRINRAATDSSCHLYGTTFDISWTNFDCRDSSHIVSLEDLKNILAEIVWDKREQGRCYAMFEHKRGCFHITTRQ